MTELDNALAAQQRHSDEMLALLDSPEHEAGMAVHHIESAILDLAETFRKYPDLVGKERHRIGKALVAFNEVESKIYRHATGLGAET